MSEKKKFKYAQNAPFVLEMKPGRYAWCACGNSKKQPFCDGSHSETGMHPRIEIVEETKPRNIRVMRAGHSLIGGIYKNTNDSVFGSFYFLEGRIKIKKKKGLLDLS
jgi:CDGSH-type Zn-finger protein